MSTPLHLIRASHLNAVTKSMHSLGMPFENLLEQVELSSDLLIEPNQLILERKAWQFLELAAESQNIPHLGILLTEQSNLSDYGEFTAKLLKADNLYQALQMLIHKINYHKNNHFAWIKESEQCVWICRPKYPYAKDKQWQLEQHVMSFTCMLVEYFAGQGWQPKVIKLSDENGVGIEQSRFFKHSDIQLGKSYSAIAIDSSLLKDRTTSANPFESSLLQSIPNGFVAGFKLLLKQNYFGREWLAEKIAASLEVSVRTLKRRLQKEGTSLRKVFDEVRFQQARDLIGQGIHDYKILAEKLDYTHQNNFVRAFKRWSGITPKEYIRSSYTELIESN